MTTTATSSTTPGRRLAGAALLVAGLFLASRLAGLAREMVISARFGTSAELDAYRAAFLIPDLLFQLVAGGALASAFIPVFAEYLTTEDRSHAWQLYSRVLNLVLWATLLLGGTAALFALPLVRYFIVPGFTPEQQILTADLMRWMMLSTLIFAASGLMMGTLNALHHFLLPGAAPIAYNLLIMGGAIWLAPAFGVYGLVVGVVAGAGAHLLIQLPGLWRKGVRYRLELSPWILLGDPDVRRIARLMGPRVLGIFFVQMHFVVNTILASDLDAGSLSALNFAWLLMLLPLGIFAQSVATVAFPALAAQIAAGDRDGMAAAFARILRIIFFFTLPAAVALFMLRVPVIQAVFERYQFTPESTQLVAFALQFYALGLVAHAVVEISVRAFFAMHDTWTPVKVGIAAMLLNIGLSFGLVRYLSFGGLALANTLATGLEMVFLLWLVRRQLGPNAVNGVFDAVLRSGMAAVIMAAVIGFVWPWFTVYLPGTGTNLGAIVQAAGGLILAGAVYLAAAFLLRSRELQPALALLIRRRQTG